MRKLLEELFRDYYIDVYKYLFSLCRDASVAEDLASETFLEVVKSLASFRWESDIKTWLFTIARRRWYAYLKWKGKEPPTGVCFREGDSVRLDERYEQMETAQQIRAALAGEPERTRRIVLLRAEGYSFREIGESIGISESSARVIYFRARTKILEKIKKEGYCP